MHEWMPVLYSARTPSNEYLLSANAKKYARKIKSEEKITQHSSCTVPPRHGASLHSSTVSHRNSRPKRTPGTCSRWPSALRPPPLHLTSLHGLPANSGLAGTIPTSPLPSSPPPLLSQPEPVAHSMHGCPLMLPTSSSHVVFSRRALAVPCVSILIRAHPQPHPISFSRPPSLPPIPS